MTRKEMMKRLREYMSLNYPLKPVNKKQAFIAVADDSSFLADAMQPLNHTTDIHTTTGEIWAAIPHGSLTSISNIRGNVKAFVVPFGAANQDDSSQLHTSSDQGRTFVSLYDAPLESLEGYYDPLLKLKSKHIVKEGALKLSYPFSWYGDLEARILHSPLKFDSSLLQDFEKGDSFVKAKRGREGENVMEAYIDTGELAVLIGL
ncbi:hypothetical protein CC86DRAFT_411749 [Ophiobolus disseminans]|uniref:Uncharacterized protein n=1 Tax=Ophiobolus disseminans TaxID=1469910 RepID=A0A6A6ZJ54_9PLEO|nr:hypothetical protein CC86DRAFT_411749 [Ophiobolus disseminans]